MQTSLKLALAALAMSCCATAQADITVTMNLVDENGIGKAAGTITISESAYGLVFTPTLIGLAAGLHGFHLHETGNCGSKEKEGKKVAALAAGGHYDPAGAKKHGTPWGDGHLGDLPPLFVDAAGNANQAVLAPRLKMADLAGRAIMLHVGGDNHSDHPAALGGGGARVVCGTAP